jgi:N6-L-threonylcarbamoyladenine synthase
MIILGIETSCDDTGIAIVKATPTKVGVKFDILANIVSPQIKVHQKYGGVVPTLAAREHLKNIEPCLRKTFQETNLKPSNIDLIAVTVGPGLIPSLLVGVHFAKALAYKWKKPIIGINHIEAHILANYFKNLTIDFPAIAITVSGGHTQLVLVKDIGKYKIIGETRDDAAGECFDKVAKLLKLGYPGGPAISKQAEKCKKTNIKLPRPMIDQKNYDFSFSGLKTAVLYTTQKKKIPVPELCKEAQQAIVDVLIDKTIKAAKEYKAKTIILAGGVAANKELRNQLDKKIKKELKAKFLIPDFKLCTDNGAMIALTGYFAAQRHPASRDNKSWNKIKANANLRLS